MFHPLSMLILNNFNKTNLPFKGGEFIYVTGTKREK